MLSVSMRGMKWLVDIWLTLLSSSRLVSLISSSETVSTCWSLVPGCLFGGAVMIQTPEGPYFYFLSRPLSFSHLLSHLLLISTISCALLTI